MRQTPYGIEYFAPGDHPHNKTQTALPVNYTGGFSNKRVAVSHGKKVSRTHSYRIFRLVMLDAKKQVYPVEIWNRIQPDGRWRMTLPGMPTKEI